MTQNGPKRPKKAQNGPRMTQNGPMVRCSLQLVGWPKSNKELCTRRHPEVLIQRLFGQFRPIDLVHIASSPALGQTLASLHTVSLINLFEVGKVPFHGRALFSKPFLLNDLHQLLASSFFFFFLETKPLAETVSYPKFSVTKDLFTKICMLSVFVLSQLKD